MSTPRTLAEQPDELGVYRRLPRPERDKFGVAAARRARLLLDARAVDVDTRSLKREYRDRAMRLGLKWVKKEKP